jgi:RimJ/RimL family protein N-acetyltransferase
MISSPRVTMDRPDIQLPRETERLVLRSPSPEDALEIQAAIEESFESLHPWMPWAAQIQTLEETEAFLEGARAKLLAGEDFAVTAFLKDTGQFVLGSGLHPRNWRVPTFEIGYWCRLSMQRHGFTTEAVRALTQIALLELAAKRVEIRCDSRNTRSRRVAQLAGFHLEAELRSDDRANDGSLRDTVVYAVIRDEYQAKG